MLAKRALSKQFRDRRTTKVYHALTWGVPKEPQGMIETNIGLGPKTILLQKIYPFQGEVGRTAKTAYEVVQSFKNLSLLKVRLYTGRTHQIRVHLQHIGHPIVGDFLYGGLDGNGQYTNEPWVNALLEKMPRQALHAGHLGVYHPLTDEPLTLEAPLPQDILDTLEWIAHESI